MKIYHILDQISSIPKFLLENTCLKRQSIEVLKPGRVPSHIGFIMDGNRRYAKERGLPTKEGHRAGAQALVHALESCFEIGVKEITIYAFSIENFNRPKEEVDDLLHLLKDNVRKINEKSMIQKHHVQLRLVGNKSLMDPDVVAGFEKIEEATHTHKVIRNLNVCFAYTSRDEMARSIREISAKREAATLSKNEISETLVAANFYAGESTEPLDLLVRTSGHTRLSDFLLWQCSSNCKIVFLETLWPEFRFWELYLTLLRWSFEQTVIHSRHHMWSVPNAPKTVSLRSLPPCPPFATVTEKTKAA